MLGSFYLKLLDLKEQNTYNIRIVKSIYAKSIETWITRQLITQKLHNLIYGPALLYQLVTREGTILILKQSIKRTMKKTTLDVINLKFWIWWWCDGSLCKGKYIFTPLYYLRLTYYTSKFYNILNTWTYKIITTKNKLT